MWRVAVLTVSDSCAAGQAQDQSGPLAVELLESDLVAETVDAARPAAAPGFQVAYYGVVPDERSLITERIKQLSGQEKIGGAVDAGSTLVPPEPVDLIVTTGGTGIASRDVTPEATMDACNGRSVWGLSFLMLQVSLQFTPLAALSRYGAGVCGATLVVNLPGKPRAVREILPTIKPVLAHGCALLRGTTRHEESYRAQVTSEQQMATS
ncbi:hypothetical protein CCYA_CCYA06G1920 [Cyanidiococcus yangmingshanensis]|nr:hypothetical protein CCYA_CCYA06G1920 [Cyanidiococcus yangmingshanensis]